MAPKAIARPIPWAVGLAKKDKKKPTVCSTINSPSSSSGGD
ncbi:unnamed protein product [marine sediment metagenome]|uniref:Uncharacterized protein n=1 Tax=marine sediment metagenome TaxID=412755 RepID=X1NB94_9ZZZZ